MFETIWHITWGTYGDRLHGDERPTVDRRHNVPGTPFLAPNPTREQYERSTLRGDAVCLTVDQMVFIERTIPAICVRGDWRLIACAAGPNHVHVLLGCDSRIQGKQVRQWLKRWLGEAMTKQWPRASPDVRTSWWAEGGSTKPVKDEAYFANAKQYVEDQKATAVPGATPGVGPGRHAPARGSEVDL